MGELENKASEILELYPKIKVKGKNTKLMLMGEDLILISSSGKIERVKKARVIQSKKGFELKILETDLIDAGIKEENQKI
jgi:hypothetical protein